MIVRKFDLKDYFRHVSDFPKKGVDFLDIAPLLADSDARRFCLGELEAAAWARGPWAIAALDSRGFLFGPSLADRLNVPFVMLRKAGKLPPPVIKRSYKLEYGSAEIEVQRGFLPPDSGVIVFDDVLATGGTLEAACGLVEEAGAEVAGCLVIAEIPKLGGRERLSKYPVKSLITFD